MTTPYQSKYWGHALTLKGSSDSIANLARSIANARVDLTPHQVEAALFAIRSPFSKGVLLADEVGLGKTIEAGLVLFQKWAERHRKLLLILPATLRNQWARELEEKFYLPTQILDRRAYNQTKKSGIPNPFDQPDTVLLVSYQFAAQLDDGTVVDDELCHKLIALPAHIVRPCGDQQTPDLAPICEAEVKSRLEQVAKRNTLFFDEEVSKLDGWADDLKYGPERELKETDREISDARRAAKLAQSLQETLDAQKAIRALERKRSQKRRELYESQDAIDDQREELIGKLEGQLKQRLVEARLFTMKWSLI